MGSRIRDNVRHFFECFCEIVRPSGAGKTAPWIIQKFPESYKDEEVLRSVTSFAYPCEFENVSVQHYSFVLTNIDSKWTFGFCRHDPNTETALVVLTFLPWHAAFRKFLDNIASLTNSPKKTSEGGEEQLWDFLNAAYNARVPEPGLTFHCTYNNGQSKFHSDSPCQFQLPRIPENRNLTEYYNAVDTTNMMIIFASMLYERRIIFKSKKLDRLSSCVQSANDIIYPMIWQHIFIPVLPTTLKDYLLAPMPFLIGVPESVYHLVRPQDIGEVVVLDADANTVQTPFDDLESLPQEIVSTLKRTLKNRGALLGDGVSRAFLRALVQLIGGYRDALRFTPGQKITFNQDAFVESRSHSMQPFLKKMLHLQIFQQFIEERLEMLNSGLGFSDEFEKEACKYSEKSSSSKFKQQYKEFIKSVKDKANPAVKSAVKSVKEGGKGMRHAYKGLRSKFRDSPDSLDEYHHSEENKPSRSAPNSPTMATRSSSKPFYIPLSPPSNPTSPNDEESSAGVNHFTNNLRLSPLNMDLLHEMQDVLYKRHIYNDSSGENTPPVDRSLKPVRSLENFKQDGTKNKNSNWWVDLEDTSNHLINSSNDDVFQAPSLINDLQKTTKDKDLSNDLIRLDSTPSDSIDDFDPLLSKSKTTIPSVPLLPPQRIPEKGLSNPLYPYFVPTCSTTSQDQDLLNEYGLDFQKFSLNNGSAGPSRDPFDPFEVPQQRRQWTKFE